MNNYFEDMLAQEERSQLLTFATMPQFLTWINYKWGELPALSDTCTTKTYHQLYASVTRKRSFLNSIGLSLGDHIAFIDSATTDAVETFLAITSGGYVAVPFPAQLTKQDITACCQFYDIAALFYGDAYKATVQDLTCRHFPIISELDQEAPLPSIEPTAPAAIYFTGGATGRPKGAILSHQAILRGALNGCYAPGKVLACQRYAHVLPLSHVFGMIRGTLSVLYTGSLWVSAGETRNTLQQLATIRPTTMVAVPGICEIMLELTRQYGEAFLGGKLTTIISGAANVLPKLIQEFDELGIHLFAGYGLTEAANLTSGNIDVLTRPTSVGQIYPKQQVKLVDNELWIKGDNVFSGYYHNHEETARVLTKDGWLRTGDLARVDDEGYLYITGRIKNIIVLPTGENISPETIEDKFYACPKLKDCLVYETELNGRPKLAIDILPRMEAFKGELMTQVETYFCLLADEINRTLPTSHRVVKVNIRTEDFKRTGAMKVARNQQ